MNNNQETINKIAWNNLPTAQEIIDQVIKEEETKSK